MDHRAGKANNSTLAWVLILCLSPSVASGQSLSENITQLSGSGSVFAGSTHTRTDQGDSTDTNTEPSLGVSGNLGGQLESGAKSLTLRYNGTLETRRDQVGDEQTDSSSFTGASRFAYADPGNRFDFNLGHTVSSVRNDTGFVVNTSNFDTRNTLSAGAGLSFFPGDLTSLRFSARAGQSFGKDDLNDEESVTATSELSRRLSGRSSASLVSSRSWSENRGVDTTTDSAQFVYNRALESGSFRMGAGASRADTKFPGGADTENKASTGFLERSWVAPGWRTSLQYNRSLSDSATDLSLDSPAIPEFLPDSIRVRDLVVSDSVGITHSTSRICGACSLALGLQAERLESQTTNTDSHEYSANLNLGVQLTNLQRLNVVYSWQGDAGEKSGTISEQIHRFNISWSRQLAEDTSFGVQFNQSYLRSNLARSDQDQFAVRLVLTTGFALTGNN